MRLKNGHFFILLLLIFTFPTSAQNKRLFDYNNGLSNSLINQIYQDHLGFIWVATEDGLNRFDGIKFKSFSQTRNDKHSLKDNYVTTLLEDRKGNLWVGLINGLQVYDHETETFKEVELYVSDERIHLDIRSIIEASNGDIWISTLGYGLIRIDRNTGRPKYSTRLNQRLCSLNLRCIYEDKDGVLWLGSDNDGLNSYNPQTGEIQTFSVSENENNSIPSNDIISICEDDNGLIYIGSLKGGLARIDKNTGIIERIHCANSSEVNLPVKDLLFDSKKQLWVGTDGMGLKRLNPQTNLLESIAPGSSSFDFSKSKIHSIIEDNAGNIWVGIFQKGLYLFPGKPELFNHYGYRAFEENSIGSSCITAIDGDEKELWIGTDGDGLYKLNRSNQKVEHIQLKNRQGKIAGSNILTVYNDTTDYLWIGTYINGMIRYNKANGNLKTYKNDPNNPNSILYDKIIQIKKDINDQLLICTLGGGIFRYDIKKDLFYTGLDISDSINHNTPKSINNIYIDKDHNFWLATYVGLLYINHKTNSTTHFSESNGTLRNNTVYCIQSDSEGNIWAGTYGGLVKIDPSDMNSKTYAVEDGLCNNVICAINEDEYHQLWISTHNGLSRFNPKDESFTNYYAYDGIQANEFTRNATFKSEKQELFFGGINGITEVKRDYQEYSRSIRDVMLTEFISFDKHVNIGDKSGKHLILEKSIVLADTVRLQEQDNVFSIGFTSVELANQSRVSYEYMMEGFDLSWNVSDPQNRRATYTNLKHGTYTFLVRGVDKEQHSTPRKLTIIIYPPWYKTRLAKIIWIALAGIFFYGVFLFYKEKIMRHQAEKMNEMKMQFFINISHEIKTPLTLIIDPLEKLLGQNFDEKTSRLYQIMHQNANRIFRLVSQLMDVRKIDKGLILVKYQQTNIYNFIRKIAQSYELLATDKKISFNIKTSDPDIVVWIDPLNFEKVILNLLSNAFKFTPAGGEVELSITKEMIKNNDVKNPAHVVIEISDSGIGIKESDLERIFDRFYQVDSQETRYSTGTGVGLHLAQSLVNLHKGKLSAENRTDGPGSRFKIVLPMGNEHLPKEDLINENNIIPAPSHIFLSTVSPEPSNSHKEKTPRPKTNYKIMIVDDEEEIRNYLFSELSTSYKIVACENGKKAHEILLDEKPDLIISDIMMPEMDGITFCKKIKGNILTSHIPVILLTALSKEEDKTEGIETGADMYLAKPFNSDFLRKIISNILENRRKIVEQLQNKKEQYDIENIEIESHDEILMQKVMSIIKDNIADSNLNVEMLADGVGISRVHMHRKLKELTNQSARDFIKNIRMKQAAYLLTNKKINVSEVAYAVGFSNLSHFSKTFKSYYGVSPKEYIQKQHGDKTPES